MRFTSRRRFSLVPRPGGRPPPDGQGQPEDPAPADQQPVRGKRQIALIAMDHKKRDGGDTTWILRVREAPEHIKENWPSCSWIVEVATTVISKGKRAERVRRQ